MTVASAIYTGVGFSAPMIPYLYSIIVRKELDVELEMALASVVVVLQTPIITLLAQDAIDAFYCRPVDVTSRFRKHSSYLGVAMVQGGMFAGAAYYVYNAKDNPVTLYNLKRIALFAPLVLGVLGSGSVLAFGAARTAEIAAPIFWHFVAAPLAGSVAGALAARYIP